MSEAETWKETFVWANSGVMTSRQVSQVLTLVGLAMTEQALQRHTGAGVARRARARHFMSDYGRNVQRWRHMLGFSSPQTMVGGYHGASVGSAGSSARVVAKLHVAEEEDQSGDKQARDETVASSAPASSSSSGSGADKRDNQSKTADRAAQTAMQAAQAALPCTRSTHLGMRIVPRVPVCERG